MRPCSHRQIDIALLAATELDPRLERETRQHLESCAACRAYLDEMTLVTVKLAAVEIRSDIATSESFHESVIENIAPKTWGHRGAIAAIQRSFQILQRAGLPLAGAAVLALCGWLLLESRWRTPLQPTVARPVAVEPASSPTIFYLQRAANRSLEELDLLLTLQGGARSFPAPTYSASPRALALALD